MLCILSALPSHTSYEVFSPHSLLLGLLFRCERGNCRLHFEHCQGTESVKTLSAHISLLAIVVLCQMCETITLTVDDCIGTKICQLSSPHNKDCCVIVNISPSPRPPSQLSRSMSPRGFYSYKKHVSPKVYQAGTEK